MQHPNMQDFKAFVGSKDPDETYVYIDHTNCACGQYARSIGVNWTHDKANSKFWLIADGEASDEPYTFGALAERLA